MTPYMLTNRSIKQLIWPIVQQQKINTNTIMNTNAILLCIIGHHGDWLLDADDGDDDDQCHRRFVFSLHRRFVVSTARGAVVS